MPDIRRRDALILAGGGALAVPRFAIAAGDQRPEIRIAVQLLATSTTLEPVAEQSNVQHRICNSYLETLVGLNLQGQLEAKPMLATSWRRIDDKVLEVSLRPGVKFHNGDEMTAEDVAFTFGPEHMFGATAPAGMGPTLTSTNNRPLDSGKALPPQVPPVARRIWPSLVKVEVVDRLTVRFINATPDVTLEGRLTQLGSEIISRRAFESAKTGSSMRARPWAPGRIGCAATRRTANWCSKHSTTTGAGARPCGSYASSKCRRCRSASTGCGPVTISSPATCRRTRSAP